VARGGDWRFLLPLPDGRRANLLTIGHAWKRGTRACWRRRPFAAVAACRRAALGKSRASRIRGGGLVCRRRAASAGGPPLCACGWAAEAEIGQHFNSLERGRLDGRRRRWWAGGLSNASSLVRATAATFTRSFYHAVQRRGCRWYAPRWLRCAFCLYHSADMTVFCPRAAPACLSGSGVAFHGALRPAVCSQHRISIKGRKTRPKRLRRALTRCAALRATAPSGHLPVPFCVWREFLRRGARLRGVPLRLSVVPRRRAARRV